MSVPIWPVISATAAEKEAEREDKAREATAGVLGRHSRHQQIFLVELISIGSIHRGTRKRRLVERSHKSPSKSSGDFKLVDVFLADEEMLITWEPRPAVKTCPAELFRSESANNRQTAIDMWRHALNDQFSYQRLPPRAAQSDSKSSIGEVSGRHDFGAWDRDTHKQPHKRTKTLGGELHCDPEVMKPSPTVPSNVNKVRPADLKVIAALGDSITVKNYPTGTVVLTKPTSRKHRKFFEVASLSKDYEDDVTRDIYPGNSYIIGGDGTLEEQITVGKVLREFNPNLVGLSHGTGYNNTVFNVAVGGMTSEDMPRQARDLIKRMKKKGEPITREAYKANLVEAISLLRESLNRTIVSIVSMWNSQLVFDAQSLIEKGKRMQCGDHYMEKRDILCNEYRKVAYEIQNERRFDNEDFTVVVQGFMDNIQDAFRNKDGAYDKSFYAEDMFHLSKYGNGVIGKFLWNSMLEPVGKKSDDVQLGHDSIPLKCPTRERPFVQTLSNK
ncbi:hypothetical protein ANCCEY_12036 [Ancylostoma ceylanicum]|uniref:Uncharacterized protein n=1 Tax=Ancylostoma ceylanicum TaxID=53326 RepID=A0A0D6LML4_9BILA|nr:hypothetical protein ANCCEY_12036 [Ancylostoma ceylanicum]